MIVEIVLRKLREVVLAGGCKDRLREAVDKGHGAPGTREAAR